jgi:hypothetical protein
MARAPRLPRSGIPRIAAHHAGPIVGLDVETAAPTHGAICALGVALVLRGEVVHERHWYLNPQVPFDPRFIAIHGITPDRVAGAPTLAATWSSVLEFIQSSVDETRAPKLFPDADAGDALPLSSRTMHPLIGFKSNVHLVLRCRSAWRARLRCRVVRSRRARSSQSRDRFVPPFDSAEAPRRVE